MLHFDGSGTPIFHYQTDLGFIFRSDMDDFVTGNYDATGGEGEARGQWRHIIVPLAAALITIAVCITFILTCLTTPKIRRDTSKWLQILVALSVLIYGIADNFYRSAHETGANRLWELKGFCGFFLPLRRSFSLLTSLAMVAVSLERLVSLWKAKKQGSSFTKKATLVVSAVLVVVCLVLSYIIHNVVGEVEVTTTDGVTSCEVSTKIARILGKIVPVAPIVNFLLTVIMICKLIKVRHCDGEAYPLDRILPFILGNCVMVVHVILSMVIAMNHLAAYLVVLLIWLLGQSDTRNAIRTACCPCLPEKKDGDVEMA